jgi:kynurenine formamidase
MDTLEFTTSGRRWRVHLAQCFDLATALEFDGPQPRFFAGDPARSVPLRAGAFTGQVADGASCNCSVHTIAPHCHGTHTECVGHVTGDGTFLTRHTPAPPSLALLVSVQPVSLRSSGDGRPAVADDDDPVISRSVLAGAASGWTDAPWTALVMRTLPNEVAKRHREYTGACAAPYLTTEAMQWIVARGVMSLVVDLPSLDRADDGGALAAHRSYWGLPAGSTDARQASRASALVTELAFVPDAVADGLYLLDLQVPAFAADAAPSRPVLYPVTEASA